MPQQDSFSRRSIQSVQRELLGNWRHKLLLASIYAFPLAPPEELEGDDPAGAHRTGDAPTFAAAAKAVHQMNLPRWRNKHAANEWLASLERYAFASIGEVPLQCIERSDIIAVLSPIWTTKPETARRAVELASTAQAAAHLRTGHDGARLSISVQDMVHRADRYPVGRGRGSSGSCRGQQRRGRICPHGSL